MKEENKHIGEIKLKGFKSIESLELKLQPINILIGANGSGKSNFISFFSLLRNICQGRLVSYVKLQKGADSFFHFGSKTTKEISINIQVNINAYHAIFMPSQNDDDLVITHEYCTIDSNEHRTKYDIKGTNGESGLFSGEAKNKYVRDYTNKYLRECRVNHFHDTSSSAGFKKSQFVSDSDQLAADAYNIAPFLYRLMNDYPDSYQNIVQSIKTVAPFFHDFSLVPRGEAGDESIILRWSHTRDEQTFSANQLSDGTLRFICLSTLFLQPEVLRPKTIILDEPELGLHPAALEVLSDLVKVTSKNNQIICSTQSVAFSNHFQP